MKKIERIKKIFTLQVEKQLRCGDGGIPNTYSHSMNCDCKRIDKEIDLLNKEKV